MAKLLRTDGTEEDLGLVTCRRASELVAGGRALDWFMPAGGGLVFVDDLGLLDGKPRNDAATELYHTRTGGTGSIHGDAIVLAPQEGWVK